MARTRSTRTEWAEIGAASLTAQLGTPHSPARRVFSPTLSQTKPLQAEVRARLSVAHLVAPSPTTPGSAQLVGTAFDRFSRVVLPNGDQRLGTALTGICIVMSGTAIIPHALAPSRAEPSFRGYRKHRGIPAACISEFLESHAGRLKAYRDIAARTPQSRARVHQRRELARDIVVLAMFEQMGRSGGMALAGSPLARSEIPTSCATLRAVASDADIDQVLKLSEPWELLISARAGHTCIHNPTFDASHLVGGADADVVMGGTLLELKCTKVRGISAGTLWQLAAYTALDLSDEHRIRAVGVYLARYGTLLEWPIELFLTSLHGAPLTLGAFRVRSLRGLLAVNPGIRTASACRKLLAKSLPSFAPARELDALLRDLRRRPVT
jgi:hypothetical protein